MGKGQQKLYKFAYCQQLLLVSSDSVVNRHTYVSMSLKSSNTDVITWDRPNYITIRIIVMLSYALVDLLVNPLHGDTLVGWIVLFIPTWSIKFHKTQIQCENEIFWYQVPRGIHFWSKALKYDSNKNYCSTVCCSTNRKSIKRLGDSGLQKDAAKKRQKRGSYGAHHWPNYNYSVSNRPSSWVQTHHKWWICKLSRRLQSENIKTVVMANRYLSM